MFATTRWSIVQAAGGVRQTPVREALATLCESYWFPLYCFVRHCGHGPDAAEDYTQSFFTFMLDGQMLAAADPQRGRFRSFLLKSMQNFLAAQQRSERTLKRGGGKVISSLDVVVAEGRYADELVDHLSPERAYEHQWALTVLRTTLEKLRAEYHAKGREELFQSLEPHLSQTEERVPLKELAARWGITEEAVKSAAHRLRLRYRELLRQEVAETLIDPSDIDDELHRLMNAVSADGA